MYMYIMLRNPDYIFVMTSIPCINLEHSGNINIYWKLVDNGAVPTIKFSIAKLVEGNTFIDNYILCLSQKAFIIKNIDDTNMLSKRSEFISKCRHINKRLLNDNNDWLWCVFVFTVCFFCITYEIFLFLWVKILTEDCLAWN